MLEFRCCDCKVPITIEEEERDQAVVCYNCNRRQAVPEDAKVAPEKEEEPEGYALPGPEGPAYWVLAGVGWLLIVLGWIVCGGAVIVAVETRAFGPLLQLVIGVITLGLGCALHCLRTIAIDVWHLRNSPRKPEV